jgi:hypothetical protein
LWINRLQHRLQCQITIQMTTPDYNTDDTARLQHRWQRQMTTL